MLQEEALEVILIQAASLEALHVRSEVGLEALLTHQALEIEQHHLPLDVRDAAEGVVGIDALQRRAELRELMARAEKRHILRQPQAVVADQQLLIVLGRPN